MGLSISLTNLASRVVRSELLQGAAEFTLGGSGEITQQEDGGWLGNIKRFGGWLGRGAYKAGGWLLGTIIKGLNFGFSTIWGWCVNAYIGIYNFNWNITDENIEAQFTSLKLQLMSQLGGLAGNLFGWTACGIAPAAIIMAFNETLGLRLLKEVGEEALDEFLGNMESLLQASVRIAGQSMLMNAFKGVRNWLKKAAKDPNSWAGKALEKAGFSDKQVASWGEKGAEPWSFALAVEEAVDSIKNPFVREFVEEFLEEAGEACIEAGYVVAGGLDRYVAEQRMARESILGSTRIVEVTPQRSDDDTRLEERIIIAGPEQIVRPQIVQTLATYQLIENRDVGMIMGESLREYTRANIKSPSALNNLSLRILMFSRQSPPFFQRVEGIEWDKTQITVPRVLKTKLDWNTIRFAIGGSNGYMIGPWVARGELADNSGQIVDRIVVCGDSEASAVDRLETIVTMLSELEILRINCSKQTKSGTRGRYLYRDPIRVYPGFCTVINAQKIANEEEGRTELTGAYKRSSSKLDLWGDSKPPYWEAEIQDLLFSPGADV